MMPQPTEQYGQMVRVSLAPAILMARSCASAGAGAARGPRSSVLPEIFKKSLLDTPMVPSFEHEILQAEINTKWKSGNIMHIIAKEKAD
jgi:hypothetical protein